MAHPAESGTPILGRAGYGALKRGYSVSQTQEWTSHLPV